MVEEDRVEDLPPGRRQAERDVGDPEDRLAFRKARLDRANALDRLDRGADVVRVAGTDRKHECVEDQVAGRQAVLASKEIVAALGDCELARAGDRHALALVFVDAADDDRPAVVAKQGHDLLEPFLAILEIDRVHDRLALAMPERRLDHASVCGVDHERHLHLAGDVRHEPVHVGGLVPIGIGQAHVEDLRPVLDLPAPDLGGLLELVGDDQLLEPPRADHVRALTHEQGAVVVGRKEDLDPADRLRLLRRRDARRPSAHQRLQRADVRRRRAAAAADEVHPALVDEARHLEGQARRGLGEVEALPAGIAALERGLVGRSGPARGV